MEDLRTKLIIIQPTSFCNLNCRYCYVPFRQDHNFMSDEVLDSAIKLSLESPFLQNEVEFLYHAGEPLTVGIDFYKKAMQFIERYNSKNINVINNIQTNGVLLNDKWCTFLKDYHFKVGISIDGPEFLHDKNRK